MVPCSGPGCAASTTESIRTQRRAAGQPSGAGGHGRGPVVFHSGAQGSTDSVHVRSETAGKRRLEALSASDPLETNNQDDSGKVAKELQRATTPPQTWIRRKGKERPRQKRSVVSPEKANFEGGHWTTRSLISSAICWAVYLNKAGRMRHGTQRRSCRLSIRPVRWKCCSRLINEYMLPPWARGSEGVPEPVDPPGRGHIAKHYKGVKIVLATPAWWANPSDGGVYVGNARHSARSQTFGAMHNDKLAPDVGRQVLAKPAALCWCWGWSVDCRGAGRKIGLAPLWRRTAASNPIWGHTRVAHTGRWGALCLCLGISAQIHFAGPLAKTCVRTTAGWIQSVCGLTELEGDFWNPCCNRKVAGGCQWLPRVSVLEGGVWKCDVWRAGQEDRFW